MSFVSPSIASVEFTPSLPWRHPLLQSLLGQIGRLPEELMNSQAWSVPLPDGDHVALFHNPPLCTAAKARPKVALIVHGIGGNENLFHITRMTQRLRALGYHTCRYSARGRGPSKGLAKRPILGTLSHDLIPAVLRVRKELGDMPIHLIGYSLGGNMCLHYAGLAGLGKAPKVQRCVAVSAPVDLSSNAQKLTQTLPVSMQRRIFAKLTSHIEDLHQRFGDLGPVPKWPSPMTVQDLDNLYAGPQLHAQLSLVEQTRHAQSRDQPPLSATSSNPSRSMLQEASCGPLLHAIRCPTLMLWSWDDPFIDTQAITRFETSREIQLQATKWGGHVGFVHPYKRGAARWWLDQRIVDWLASAKTQAMPR